MGQVPSASRRPRFRIDPLFPTPSPILPLVVLSCLREAVYAQKISKPTTLPPHEQPIYSAHHAGPRAPFPPGIISNWLYQFRHPLAGCVCVFLEVLPRSERMVLRAKSQDKEIRGPSRPSANNWDVCPGPKRAIHSTQLATCYVRVL